MLRSSLTHHKNKSEILLQNFVPLIPAFSLRFKLYINSYKSSFLLTLIVFLTPIESTQPAPNHGVSLYFFPLWPWLSSTSKVITPSALSHLVYLLIQTAPIRKPVFHPFHHPRGNSLTYSTPLFTHGSQNNFPQHFPFHPCNQKLQRWFLWLKLVNGIHVFISNTSWNPMEMIVQTFENT